MYEVEKSIWNFDPSEDLNTFFEQTKNFGKKFYHVGKGKEHSQPKLMVTALAVSRDVTYILRWDISCKDLIPPEVDIGDLIPDMIDRTFPPWGLLPDREPALSCYFPNDPKEYSDTFMLHNFTEVQKLMKDGVSII